MVQRITIDPSQVLAEAALIKLKAEHAHYLMRVLRLKVGDRFIAQDGQGNQWLAAIAEQSDHAHLLEKISNTTSSAPTLRLIAALPKGNSFDAVVRQTTELGVTHIYPVMAERTLLKPSANKLARWKRIAQEASEQSERITVPEIIEPTPFKVCLSSLDETLDHDHGYPTHSLNFICAARSNSQVLEKTLNAQELGDALSEDDLSGNGLSESMISKTGNNNHLLSRLLFHNSVHQQQPLSPENLLNVVIAIGPEGGWTTDEITVAVDHGYEVVSLGSGILRAVTAPITALSLVTAARDLLI